MSRISVLFYFILVLNSCVEVHHAAEYNLKTGIYKTISSDNRKIKMYLNVHEDSVRAYTLLGKGNHVTADSLHYINYTFPPISKNPVPSHTFIQEGIDIDLISIIFKFRPARTPLPPQLNTNFNAAGYFGYRWDKYSISYERTPLKMYERTTNHFAYGTGIFAGLGATALNEYVTVPSIDRQYDGVVITKGVTGIIGIGHFSFGVAIGSDMLLGEHKNQWLYNNKLWFGLNLGLNLN